MADAKDWSGNRRVMAAAREAAETIVHYWDEWDAEAGQDAQQQQNPMAWDEMMVAQVEAVLLGFLDEATG